MKFFILDHGLVDRRAHNLHLIVAVTESLRRRGIDYATFVARRAEKTVLTATNATPFFRHYLYESIGRPNIAQVPAILTHLLRNRPGPVPRDSPRSEIASWRKLNASYRRDLSRLPPEIWEPQNTVLIPGTCQNQILGLVQHLAGMPPSQRPHVICQLMFAPEWTPWGENAVHGEGFYRDAFARAAALVGQSLFFTTETQGLSDLYRDRYDIVPSVLNIPLSVPIAEFTRAPNPEALVLGYLGYSKTSRGFHLLPETIALLQTRGCKANFLIQVQHSNWEPEIVTAVNKLRTMDSVRLVEGALDQRAYYDFLRECDAILLPYDAAHYGERGSGVIVEAVSSGRPVVASSGTWAEKLLRNGDAVGELFSRFEPADFAQAIERLLQRIEPAARTAAAIAPAFAERFSSDTYVDAVLAMGAAREPKDASPVP